MDDSPQTRLEWMRLEFQDARRRRLVKTSERGATSQANTTETQPPAQAEVIDPLATKRRGDHPTAR
jgi:hypothetical protein